MNRVCFSVHPPLTRQAPAVDDITVEDQLFTMGVLEEVVHLVDFAVGCSQMHIGENDGFEG